ncbi:sigma-54 dependent transcriptional regulator [bacterium]|nr:sigma-54 dependent transcriptional regulator [bacterium]MCI0602281.1 sigma-54 dependent transcriptional regulator [bacterium]
MKILIVDDEKNIRTSLSRFFDLHGFQATAVENGSEALEQVRKSSFDCIVLDLKLPDLDGIQLLEKIREIDFYVPVVLLTAHGSTSKAVEAIKKGAFDFFEKPTDEEKLLIAVRNAHQLSRLNREKSDSFRDLDRKYQLVGESQAMKSLRDQIDRVAGKNTRVLITGESGTGKELIAYAIHRKSSRRDKPFVKVNCAAIPQELFESELFGHEKGAFTGAIQQRIGKFEQADGGTLFLDEIGEIPVSLQPKILRALQENEIQRVGGQKEILVDVRILAATNRKLEEEVKKGMFREDLYYRLNVFPVLVPPLRERREDLPVLVSHFLIRVCEENNIKPLEIREEATQLLCRYDFPGNIRELRNLMERLMILATSQQITSEDVHRVLPRPVAENESRRSSLLYSRLEDTERELILKTLEDNRWQISKVARILGLERSHLYKKMKHYNISRPE